MEKRKVDDIYNESKIYFLIGMNLLNEILERLEYERLIEEGRDPSELLHYKYQNVPSNVIDAVIKIDPTKKKSYSQWLLSHWNNESDVIIKGLNDGSIEKLFQHYKNHNDIQIKDCPSVKEGLRDFVPKEDSVLSKSSNPTTYVLNLGKEVDSKLANDFDIVYNDGNWVIAVPNTYEAECKLGENMKWCTANAYGNGLSYYEEYLSKGGKYYVNFDMTNGESRNGKDYPFTRYQFHFESKQFMDKNDDPVDVNEIGMPDGAREFYISEGYDYEDFEDLEAKIERYENERQQSYFAINDDLYLNIEYDDEYEYIPPSDDTVFFIFDINDSRDPINWEEIQNPFTNDDVVIEANDEFAILKAAYLDDGVVLAIRENNNYYRGWEAYKLSNYIILPNNDGVFGINLDSKHFTHFTCNGSEGYQGLNLTSCDSIQVNEFCTYTDRDKWGRTFVETVENGYHSLFEISYDQATSGHDFECLIKKDVPINGKSYFINENGIIEGEFGKYNAYDDGTTEGEKYQFEEKLDNGDYVVSRMVEHGLNKIEEKNVMSKDTRQIILTKWVDDVISYELGLYETLKDGLFGVFGINGEQIGVWYKQFGVLDAEHGIFGGYNKDSNFDLISSKEGKVYARFRGFFGARPINNKIVVLCDDGKQRCYDILQRQFCFQEFDTMLKINEHDNRYFWCKLKDREDAVIFDFLKQAIVVNSAVGIKKLDRFFNIYKIVKPNGKYNVFGRKNDEYMELLPNDVDELMEYNFDRNIIIYKFNNRYYVYNYQNDVMFVNQNGTDVQPRIFNYSYINYNWNNINIIFDGNNVIGWTYGEPTVGYRYGMQRMDENTPKEVVDLYNRLVGNYSSVSESFKMMVKRIDEIRKMSFNDILN